MLAVAAGGVHSLALRNNGSVLAWGSNVFGETNVPPGLTGGVALDANYGYSLVLKANGTVTGWGIALPAIPAGLTNVAAVSAGSEHCLALLRDGTVVQWGNLDAPPAGLSNVVGIAAGRGHSVVVKADGRVVAWGNDVSGKTNVPTSLANAVAVAAGDDHNLALKSDGTVTAWGLNSRGQTTVPSGLNNVIAIAAGSEHSLALRADGSVAVWGRNDYGQGVPLPTLTGATALSGGLYHNLALAGDGAPVITLQPFSQTVSLSRNLSFRVFAAGNSPLGYQWSRNGTNLAGATSSVLAVNNVQLTHAGTYQVIITNASGAVTSAPAILTTVATPPWIVAQPQDTSAFCGEGTTLRITTDGSTPIRYQWFFQEAAVDGATNATLTLNRLTTANDGIYSVVATNTYGAITSRLATLTVVVEPPTITSALTASGKQGVPFTYTIRGRHSPTSFSAVGLPGGLDVNPTNGVIQGVPLESGLFNVTIGTANACAADAQVLALTIAPSVPIITSSPMATGAEGVDLNYQITATESPTGFGAQNLPVGLRADTATGAISGQPVYAGDFDSTIWASNTWGVGSASLHFTISNRTVAGLAITDVTYVYSSPYLLDFQFALRDNEDPALANPVVVNPTNLVVICKEDDKPISLTETAYLLSPGAGVRKLVKVNQVLDFSQSIASLSNGDANGDGISDAVDTLVVAAQDFVTQLTPGSHSGVFEFHREDMDPQQVIALTPDAAAVNEAIAGIWTNYVDWFPAGSRCWDALAAAVTDLGDANPDEQHYVVFVSDGRDESSTATVEDIITAATNANVRVYAVGFGTELDPTDLMTIATETSGRYFEATNVADLAFEFAQISKDIGGQYLLRWTTLRRGDKAFMPSFEVHYQGLIALSPTNPVWTDYDNPIIDTNETPPTTNYPLVTNIIIGWYTPTEHAPPPPVTNGVLRLVQDIEGGAQAATLRASYVPRYIRQLRLHYRPNWPCTASLLSAAPGEILHGWSLTETNDDAGGRWLHLVSPYPESLTNSLPFGVFGSLVKFTFRDLDYPTNAFSLFAVDNSVQTNASGRVFATFTVENTNEWVTVYPTLPFGTPVPWLRANGFTGNYTNAEISDPDNDGALTWQEYQADTNPRNAASVFAAQPPAATGLYGHYQVTFSSSANRTYRLESSADLITWQTLVDQIPGTGGDVTVTDPDAPWNYNPKFYRLIAW